MLVTAGPSGARSDAASEFADIVAGREVVSVFQPIVDLDSAQPVAFEALARGPHGPWSRPDVLFSFARQAGLLAELDQACSAGAILAAARQGVLDRSTVFVNIEPAVIDRAALVDLAAIVPDGCDPARIVLEFTERALARRPAELLRTVRLVRELGWGIALDDVGAEPASLAFLSLLEPDVIKIDLELVQGGRPRDAAVVMHSVNAYAERSGALVLAEGIETETHLETARALGASLGQGWLFGRPVPEPDVPCTSRPLVAPRTHARRPVPATEPSPFSVLPEGVVMRRSSKRLLIELSKHLEAESLRVGETCVVASTFQHARHFTPLTRARYHRLAERVGFVCAIGEDMPVEPLPGVRGASLSAEDVVRNEWDLVALSPHFAVALLARDVGDQGPDLDRTFEYALTYHRDTVIDAARALLDRVRPQGTA